MTSRTTPTHRAAQPGQVQATRGRTGGSLVANRKTKAERGANKQAAIEAYSRSTVLKNAC